VSAPLLRSSEYASDLFDQPPAVEASPLRPLRFQRPMDIDISELPTRRQCDFLVEVFLESYHPINPVIHVPSFLTDYEAFWGSVSEPSPRRNPASVSLLLAVLFVGCAIGPSSKMILHFSDTVRTELSQKLYRQTTKALKQASFARTPAIESFTAYLISQTVWYRGVSSKIPSSYIRSLMTCIFLEEEPLRCWYASPSLLMHHI
jgi:hypothetical protein